MSMSSSIKSPSNWIKPSLQYCNMFPSVKVYMEALLYGKTKVRPITTQSRCVASWGIAEPGNTYVFMSSLSQSCDSINNVSITLDSAMRWTRNMELHCHLLAVWTLPAAPAPQQFRKGENCLILAFLLQSIHLKLISNKMSFMKLVCVLF